MKELKKLFQNNQDWISKKCKKDPQFFRRLSRTQKPKYFWIGCSDSRVPANEIVGLDAGELFVHRNIGNLFHPMDLNGLSVLEYAVDVLKIKHVILCGHYGCGGIRAAMEEPKQEILQHWLHSVKELYLQHKEELDLIKDFSKRCDRLVELNVLEQVYNICHSPIVLAAWKRKQPLCVHGWVYDLEKGLLKDLDACFSKNDGIKDLS